MLAQNNKFYSRFPLDVAIMQRLVMHLDSRQEGGAPLPSGGLLTPRALQLLGLSGLGSVGGFERLHFLLERAFDGDEISSVFLNVSAEGPQTPVPAPRRIRLTCSHAPPLTLGIH